MFVAVMVACGGVSPGFPDIPFSGEDCVAANGACWCPVEEGGCVAPPAGALLTASVTYTDRTSEHVVASWPDADTCPSDEALSSTA